MVQTRPSLSVRVLARLSKLNWGDHAYHLSCPCDNS